MAAHNLPNRNLWIIAALVVASVAVLAWILDAGGGLGGNVADVSVAPPPGSEAAAAGGS